MNRAARTHTFEVTYSCGTVATFEATTSTVRTAAAAWSAQNNRGVVSYIRAL